MKRTKYIVIISALSVLFIWMVGGCGGCNKQPQVTGISPTSGSEKGRENVTITGDFFKDGATVTIGGAAATSVNVKSKTEITAITPPGTAGQTVDVVVTNPKLADKPGELTGAYTYTDVTPPTITGTTPLDGSSPDYEDTVDTGVTISATFSEPVAEGSVSITVSMETLDDAMKDKDENPWISKKTGEIPGKVNYAGNTVTFVPDVPMKAARKYTVTISGATDMAGNSMGGPQTFSFTLKTPERVHFYKVKQGDTLKTIADRPETYDDGAMWTWIVEGNQDNYMFNPNKIYTGQRLFIPWRKIWVTKK